MRNGIRIANQGKSTDSKNLLDIGVDSKYPFLKAFKQGVASVNVTGAGTFTIDVTHGLKYYPAMIYFVAPDPNDPTKKYFGSSAANGPHGGIGNEAYITKEIIKFAWKDSSASPGFFKAYPYKVSFYYYIFHDKLE